MAKWRDRGVPWGRKKIGAHEKLMRQNTGDVIFGKRGRGRRRSAQGCGCALLLAAVGVLALSGGIAAAMAR
jgi:hypothetical protein